MSAISSCDVCQEFFVFLYISHLSDDLLNAALQLVHLGDRKVVGDMVKRVRSIFPRQKSVRG